jgi:dienelactone hydrolase
MPDPLSQRLDPLAYTLTRYREGVPRLAFPGGMPEAIAAWRGEASARLVEILGPFPAEKVPLRPELQPTVKKNGYTRRAVVFDTRPGMSCFGYLLVPDGLKGRSPAVICIPGHGRGVDDLEDGKEREHKDGYQHDFAIQCAERGLVTLAIEPLGFGHRRSAVAREAGPSASSCGATAGAALMLGETLLGWRVWDSLRSIDFLQTLSEVDPARIGMLGISGGGTITLYAAALDPRIKVAGLSCSFCTFRDSIYSISHCIDNFVPGILRSFEAAALAALIAPRYLFAEAGEQDKIFPLQGVRAAYRDVERAFDAQGAAGHTELHVFDAGHVFDGSRSLPRMAEWLGQG